MLGSGRTHHLWSSVGAAVCGGLLLLTACGGGDDGGDRAEGSGGGEQAERNEANEAPQDTGPVLPEGNTWKATARIPTVNVYAENNDQAEPIHQLTNPNSHDAPLTFLVDGTDVSGELIPVHLPTPPNGSKGWVRADDVTIEPNPYHIKIELGAHRLTLTNAGEQVLQTDVGLGRDGRPTPEGLYFLMELLQPPDPNGAYGPYAYGISGFPTNADVVAEFGEDSLIGIHGTNDASSFGQNVSSGCIRVPNDIITQMAELLPLGTPVEIVA